MISKMIKMSQEVVIYFLYIHNEISINFIFQIVKQTNKQTNYLNISIYDWFNDHFIQSSNLGFMVSGICQQGIPGILEDLFLVGYIFTGLSSPRMNSCRNEMYL
ncbi:hypothetical protein MS3_00001309 [Schistosoma haematobium]|uniref:Uncharacterized protein n=1 Tax=Schistosoma haematobium TaxID=6185 RepID=A0A922LTB5_SCHHA|nr:hypothetical protein MS3_00001309 [Schistosoma haematobium]KAH9592890.1 hypothetical protein MS3_00001309 [Schistosoma haematobium]